MITSEFFIGGDCYKETIDGQRIGSFFIDLINDVNVQATSPLSVILGPKYLNLGVTKRDRDINRRIGLINGWGALQVEKRL